VLAHAHTQGHNILLYTSTGLKTLVTRMDYVMFTQCQWCSEVDSLAILAKLYKKHNNNNNDGNFMKQKPKLSHFN